LKCQLAVQFWSRFLTPHSQMVEGIREAALAALWCAFGRGYEL
jgi:hypothetical protein